VAAGEIIGGHQPQGTIGGKSTSDLVRKARKDENIKAIVLRVDSPGGGVFPSEQIRRQVALTKAAGKPVIVSMGNVAASGGYWISMNADQIIADPSTITGSIGIFGLIPNAIGTMEKLGLNTDGVGTTWLAAAGDPTQPWDPRVGELIQTIINNGYAKFIDNVADARKKSVTEVDAIARGRVWSGDQARARGLVDRMGTLREAIALAGERAKLGADFPVRYVEKELSPFERFVTGWGTTRIGAFIAGKMIGTEAAFLPERQRAELMGLLRMAERAQTTRGVSLIAHCECAL
ncbi:MAG: signal peptide peptidase SppA, partial [Proteobacteria bacterium]|nr:signal peptide peptidase SppA [Burkholderiales bacterium]